MLATPTKHGKAASYLQDSFDHISKGTATKMQNKHQDIHGTKIRMQWIAQPRRNQKIESDVPRFSLANRGGRSENGSHKYQQRSTKAPTYGS